MKIWTKNPIQRPKIIERIQKLVDDSNKKKLKAAEGCLIANKEMEIMVRAFIIFGSREIHEEFKKLVHENKSRNSGDHKI